MRAAPMKSPVAAARTPQPSIARRGLMSDAQTAEPSSPFLDPAAARPWPALQPPCGVRWPVALGIAGALLLSACASPGRTPAPPAGPAAVIASAVPAQWRALQTTAGDAGATPVEAGLAVPAASAADTEAEADIAMDWPALVRDARLHEVLTRAMADSRDLRVSALTLAKARATLGVTEANAWPVISASTGLSSARTPAEANTSGQVSHARTFSAALGVSAWELDFFGRLASLRDSALQTWLASAQTQRTTRLTLVADLCTAWLNVGAAQQGRALAQRTLDSQQQTLARGRQRVALGADSPLALVSTEVAVETARRDLAAWDTTLQQARNALDLLAGAPVPEALLPGTDGPQDAPLLLASLPADLPSSLLLRRPDVQAAEFQLRAAHADIAAARAALWPSISLTASAGTASRSLGELFRGGAWSFAPTVKLPIFDGGAARATLRAGELAAELQLASYEKTVQTAFREVADALAVRATLAPRLQAQQTLVTRYQRALELTRARVEAGADSPLLQLEAERSLQTAQQALVTLRQAELANRVTLFKVLGGGWAPQREVPLAALSAR
ncbi:MAG: hypothetical protein RL223_2152 [Pseudomonadota bacterium]